MKTAKSFSRERSKYEVSEYVFHKLDEKEKMNYLALSLVPTFSPSDAVGMWWFEQIEELIQTLEKKYNSH